MLCLCRGPPTRANKRWYEYLSPVGEWKDGPNVPFCPSSIYICVVSCCTRAKGEAKTCQKVSKKRWYSILPFGCSFSYQDPDPVEEENKITSISHVRTQLNIPMAPTIRSITRSSTMENKKQKTATSVLLFCTFVSLSQVDKILAWNLGWSQEQG